MLSAVILVTDQTQTNEEPGIQSILDAIIVSPDILINISAAEEFISTHLTEYTVPYKTGFVEEYIRKHFSFSTSITKTLLSSMNKATKAREKSDRDKEEFLVPKEPMEIIPDHIIDAANEIIYTGDPVKYIMDTHASMHVGDDALATTLLISIGIQSVRNSDGIQPKLAGNSGKGKTHCCKAMIHLVPEKYKFNTTLSDKAIYYIEIPDGAIVFSDDINLSEGLEGLIKRSTSNFQEGSDYTTVDRNRNPLHLTIPPRISWWLTSVSNDQSIELLNRQFGGDVDETKGQDNAVMEYHLTKATTGTMNLPLNDDVGICRYILQDIKDNLYTVLIPFAREVVWKDPVNRRNLPIFLDIIRAFAVLRHRQRYITEDHEIIANIDDYNDAKALYSGRAGNQRNNLTNQEIKVCSAIVGKGDVDMTAVMGVLGGVSLPRTSHILFGKGKGATGLVDKVPGFIVKDQSVQNDGVTTKRKVVSLDKFDIFDMCDSVVDLKENTKGCFYQLYPNFTQTLPEKNALPLYHFTYITYIYNNSIEYNSKEGGGDVFLNGRMLSGKVGKVGKVANPTTVGEVKCEVKCSVKSHTLPKTAQKQIVNDLISYKRAKYPLESTVDPEDFTFEFCELHPHVWKSEATRVLEHVNKLNKNGWK